jgi:NADPH-dependent curcumin reductase CurA
MRQVVLAARPIVDPKTSDFAVQDAPIPEPGPNQILVRVLWHSIDPYVRLTFDDPTIAGMPGMRLGQPPVGRAVSQVVKSNNPDFTIGDIIEGRTVWAEYAVVDPAVRPTKLDFGTIPLSYAVGALGMPGQTANSGMIDVLNTKKGDTVLISAAAGAVGSMAGQIGKILGARVVGIAGGPDKCAAVEALGFDACVDYKSPNFDAKLKVAMPNGFNGYFENVGGDLTRRAFAHAAYGARVALCGVLAVYGTGDEKGPDRLPELMRLMFTKGLAIQSFFGEMLGGPAATAMNRAWIEEAALKPAESILEGIGAMPEAYAGIFRGNSHVGKVVLHIADPE